MASGEDNSKRIWASVNHAPSSYALNGKIMLCSVIVLFVAVIVILCFHSYARWLFHRQNRRIRRRIRAHLRSLSAARDPAVASSLTPLDRSVLEKIPVFVYSSKTPGATPLECAVCLSDFEDGEEGRALPKCDHAFHVECIDTWFRTRSNCPLCRAPVQPDNTSARPEQTPAVSAARASESAVSACSPNEDGETGGSSSSASSSSSSSPSSSSPVRFPPESSPRQPVELVGVVVEIPRGLDGTNPGLPNENGFKFPGIRVLSLKRIWSL